MSYISAVAGRLGHPFGSALTGAGRWGDMRARRKRTPSSPGRAALESFDVFEILEKAPHCFIVLDEQATLVYQNAASRELDATMRSAHGEALVDAVRAAVKDAGAGRRYPLTVSVVAATRTGRAHADVTIDRIVSGFVVSWSDRTHVREGSQVVTKVATELLRRPTRSPLSPTCWRTRSVRCPSRHTQLRPAPIN